MLLQKSENTYGVENTATGLPELTNIWNSIHISPRLFVKKALIE